MALRLQWVPIPSTFFRDNKHPQSTLTIKHKPSSQNPFFVSSLFFSNPSSFSNVSAITSSRSRKCRKLLVFQVSSSTQEEPTTTTVETPETSLPNEPRTRVLAQNVPWSYTVEDIRNLFEKHGTVVDIELAMYNKTRNRGLAFVIMGSEEEATAALTNLQSKELEGRIIKTEYAKTQKKKKTPPPSSPVQKTETTSNVFVGNLSWSVTSADLKEFFSSMNVVSAEVIYQQNETRRPTGYGFVAFNSKEEAETAMSTFRGKMLMGRPLRMGRSRRKLNEGLRKEKKLARVEGTTTEVDSGESLETVVQV